MLQLLFKWNKTFAQFNWNEQAVQDRDYIEVVVDGLTIALRNLWITISDNTES